jgi:hypothetical protein
LNDQQTKKIKHKVSFDHYTINNDVKGELPIDTRQYIFIPVYFPEVLPFGYEYYYFNNYIRYFDKSKISRTTFKWNMLYDVLEFNQLKAGEMVIRIY